MRPCDWQSGMRYEQDAGGSGSGRLRERFRPRTSDYFMRTIGRSFVPIGLAAMPGGPKDWRTVSARRRLSARRCPQTLGVPRQRPQLHAFPGVASKPKFREGQPASSAEPFRPALVHHTSPLRSPNASESGGWVLLSGGPVCWPQQNDSNLTLKTVTLLEKQ